MSNKILGFVMARDEWPLLGLAIVNALELGVDKVFVLDHHSQDGTATGLENLQNIWPNHIEVFRIDDERFLQEAATKLMMNLAQAEKYEWVYTFDADEFGLCSSEKKLNDVLSEIPSDIEAVRYQLNNFATSSDFDDLELENYENVYYQAIPSYFLDTSSQILFNEVFAGNLNYFDLPFPSKIIVRGRNAFQVGVGSHQMKSQHSRKEIFLEETKFKVAHLTFLSLRRLNMKGRQGQALIDAGAGIDQGWQSQLLRHLQVAGELDDFWKRHSVNSSSKFEVENLDFVATIDEQFLEVMRARVATVKDLNLDASQDREHAKNPSIRNLTSAALTSINQLIQDFDSDLSLVVADRNLVVADRDRVVADRNLVVADRDRVVADRNLVVADRNLVVADRDRVVADRDRVVADRDRVVADKNSCIEAEEHKNKKMATQLRAAEQDLFLVLNSNSLKVGLFILGPFRHLKRLLVRLTRG